MKLIFSDNAWEDYLYWHKTDKKILRRINSLIKEIKRNKEELVCRGEVLVKGNYNTIEIKLSNWDGELFLEWEVSY